MKRLRWGLLLVAAFVLAFAPLLAHAQPSTALPKPCWPEQLLVGRDTAFAAVPCDRLEALAPVMREKGQCVIDKMHKSGRPVKPYETYRSRLRQEDLYRRGRTVPGLIVTNVKDPSTGFHFWGLAIDFVHPTKLWNMPRDYWWHLGQFAEQCGLVAGAFWKRLPDQPHVNWAAWESAAQRPAWVKRLQAEGKRDSLLLRLGATR